MIDRKTYDRNNNKKRRLKWKELGMCLHCGKEKALPKRSCCSRCSIMNIMRGFGKSIDLNTKENIEFCKVLFIKQKGKCAICKIDMTSLCIDHCHKTNKIRGLLCNPCNLGLGNFKDNPKYLKKAIKYLCTGDSGH